MLLMRTPSQLCWVWLTKYSIISILTHNSQLFSVEERASSWCTVETQHKPRHYIFQVHSHCGFSPDITILCRKAADIWWIQSETRASGVRGIFNCENSSTQGVALSEPQLSPANSCQLMTRQGPRSKLF